MNNVKRIPVGGFSCNCPECEHPHIQQHNEENLCIELRFAGELADDVSIGDVLDVTQECKCPACNRWFTLDLLT